MQYITTWMWGAGLKMMSAMVISVLQSSARSSHMLWGAASKLLLIGSNSWSPSTCRQAHVAFIGHASCA